jgi:hypothetical protein
MRKSGKNKTLTWSEWILVFWVEENFESSDAEVERALRKIEDRELDREGYQSRNQNAERQNEVDHSANSQL